MDYKKVKFYRFIKDSDWDSKAQKRGGAQRKVISGRRGSFRERGDKDLFMKIYCKTNKLCEYQICRSILLPRCPHQFIKRVYLDLRTSEAKQALKEEKLEYWEYYGEYNYVLIDELKKYVKTPIEEIPEKIFKKFYDFFSNIGPYSKSKYNFFRKRFYAIFRLIEKEAEERREEAEFKKKLGKQIFRIGDYYIIEYPYMRFIYYYLTPHYGYSSKIGQDDWEKYKNLEELPEDRRFFYYIKDLWSVYKDLRFLKEKSFIIFETTRYILKENAIIEYKDIMQRIMKKLSIYKEDFFGTLENRHRSGGYLPSDYENREMFTAITKIHFEELQKIS